MERFEIKLETIRTLQDITVEQKIEFRERGRRRKEVVRGVSFRE